MKCRKIVAWVLCAVMLVSVTACGRGGEGGGSGVGAQGGGNQPSGSSAEGAFVYKPEFLALEGLVEGEVVSYDGMRLTGDELYFLSDKLGETLTQSLNRYSLTDGTIDRVPLVWPEEKKGGHLGSYAVGEDGSLYAVCYALPDASGSGEDAGRYLVKFTADGSWAGSWEITEQLQEDRDGFSAPLAVDAQGRIYLSGYTLVWLYDGDGTYKGSLSVGGGQINAMGGDRDGRVYVSYYFGSNTETVRWQGSTSTAGGRTRFPPSFPTVAETGFHRGSQRISWCRTAPPSTSLTWIPKRERRCSYGRTAA